MFFKEEIAVNWENYTKSKNTFCG